MRCTFNFGSRNGRSFQPLIVVAFGLLGALRASGDDGINFNRDIRPILSDRCFACHGPDKNARKADLRLDQRQAAIDAGAISPGKTSSSKLVERILSTDPDVMMPPPKHNKPLTAAEKELLQRWVTAGAEYQPHWAFISVPGAVAVPQTNDPAGWIRNPIDAFVLHQLHQRKLEPASDTSREKWLRRASFDLTGLPPTLAELDTFLADQSPEAYETAADRLLKSPAFGERLANEWLDVARYADTFGYQADRDTHVWPWRISCGPRGSSSWPTRRCERPRSCAARRLPPNSRWRRLSLRPKPSRPLAPRLPDRARASG